MLLQLLLLLLLLLAVDATVPPAPRKVTDHLHYLTGAVDTVTSWSTVDTTTLNVTLDLLPQAAISRTLTSPDGMSWRSSCHPTARSR